MIQALAERGHTVVLAVERQRNRPVWLPKNLTLVNRDLRARALPGRIEGLRVQCVEWTSGGTGPPLRQARDYLRFLDPRYADKGKLERRSAMHAPPGRHSSCECSWISRHWKRLARALALIEEAIPSEKFFDLFIQHEQPDVVLVTRLSITARTRPITSRVLIVSVFRSSLFPSAGTT